MKTKSFRVTLFVTVLSNGESDTATQRRLENAVTDLAQNGQLTGEGPATLENWSCEVKKVATKTKPTVKRERRKAGEHRFADCGGYPRCVTCGRDEDDAFVGAEECTFGKSVQPTCQCGSRLFDTKGNCQKCGL